MKFFPSLVERDRVIFEILSSFFLLLFSSLVMTDIILIRKSLDLNVEKESVFNNTLTFLLTSIVTMLLLSTAIGLTGIAGWFLLDQKEAFSSFYSVSVLIPASVIFLAGLILFVLLSMAPFIAVYEEGEGWYPLKRSVDLVGKKKFLLVLGGLLFLGFIQVLAGSIPYAENTYLSFFIGLFKAVFFPLNIIFSTFLMINLYQHLRQVQLEAMIAKEEYV